MNRVYSTAEVIKVTGITKSTLLRWLQAGEIPEPQKIAVGRDRRGWTKDDLQNLKRYKETHYAKRR